MYVRPLLQIFSVLVFLEYVSSCAGLPKCESYVAKNLSNDTRACWYLAAGNLNKIAQIVLLWCEHLSFFCGVMFS